MHWKCKCFHHWIPRIVQLLAWISAGLFFWSSLKQVPIWGYDALYFAWVTVILMLVSFSSGEACKCCGIGKAGGEMAVGNMCGHEGGCMCGDCGRCKPM